MRESKDGNNTLTYVLPDVVDPPEFICVTLRIPNNKFHIMAFKGAIWDLCNWWNWEKDDAHRATQVAQVWRRVFRSMKFQPCIDLVPTGTQVELPNMSDLVQVICDSNNKCILQYRCDVCSPWITVANLSDLQTNPSGAGNQPAPGGGVATYCKTVYANSSILIPTPVNAGDKIEVTSADGSWSGTPFQWRCVDGKVFFVTCTNTDGGTSGANPVSAAQTMSLIVQFSTGYYPLYPGGSLIVPSGVVNEQPTLLANKPTLTSGTGQIDVCIKVTNNQTATWTHHFDFTLSDGGWVLDPAVGACPGQYIYGVGWKSVDGNCVGANAAYLTFLKYFNGTITNIRTKYSIAGLAGSGDFDDGFVSLGTLNGAIGVYDLSFPGTHVITNHVRWEMTATGTGSNWVVTDIWISGTGTDPF